MVAQHLAYSFTATIVSLILLISPLRIHGQVELFFDKIPLCTLPCATNATQKAQCDLLDPICVCQKVVTATLFNCFADRCLFASDAQNGTAVVQETCANCTATKCSSGETSSESTRPANTTLEDTQGDKGNGKRNSLSAGAIAGIAVGVTAVVAGLCVAFFLLGKRQTKREQIKSAAVNPIHHEEMREPGISELD